MALIPRQELCLEMAEYLSARYPMIYSVQRRPTKQGSWFDEPNEICSVEMKPFGVKFDLDKEDPMVVAGLLTPVDLAVMMEGEDSLYYMKAGFIALAGSWRFEDKSQYRRYRWNFALMRISWTGFVLHSYEWACA